MITVYMFICERGCTCTVITVRRSEEEKVFNCVHRLLEAMMKGTIEVWPSHLALVICGTDMSVLGDLFVERLLEMEKEQIIDREVIKQQTETY